MYIENHEFIPMPPLPIQPHWVSSVSFFSIFVGSSSYSENLVPWVSATPLMDTPFTPLLSRLWPNPREVCFPAHRL